MSAPMSDERLAQIQQLRSAMDGPVGFDARWALDELLAEVERLRNLLGHGTEFTFRPDFDDLNDQFSDDPESHDALVVSWRGPSTEGGDPDRWAITYHGHWCWSRAKHKFVYEPRPSERDGDFFANHRFMLAEAVALVPEMLRGIEARRIPELRQAVEARTRRKAGL